MLNHLTYSHVLYFKYYVVVGNRLKDQSLICYGISSFLCYFADKNAVTSELFAVAVRQDVSPTDQRKAGDGSGVSEIFVGDHPLQSQIQKYDGHSGSNRNH